MPLAYSYVRFSRPEQARGDSRRRQTEAAAKWAAEHGMQLAEPMFDAGLSAYRGANVDEGALGAFLAAVRDGKIESGSTLIVESLDRISRQDILSALTLLLDILRSGIRVVTLSDGYIYTEASAKKDPLQLIISLTILSRAHEESRIKGERVGAAWANKRNLARSDKKPLTRICPEWLELRGGAYHLIPDRAAVVARIFRETASGIGRRTIVRRLNQEGIAPFGKAAGWQDSYISKLLSWPAAAGWHQPHRLVDGRRQPEGEPIKDFFPAVISDELYWQARAAAEQRRAGAAGRKGRTYANLLGGLARCACGSAMTYIDKGAKKGGPPRLVCNSVLRHLGCNRAERYRYLSVEMGVFFGLNDARLKALTDQQTDEQRALETQIAADDAKLAGMTKRLGRLLDLIEGDDEPGEDVGARIRALQADIKALKAKLGDQRADLAKLAAKPAADPGGTLMPLYKKLADLDGEDLFAARAALAQQLRQWVVRVELDGGRGVIVYRDDTRSLIQAIEGR